jgi:hypothetical protein
MASVVIVNVHDFNMKTYMPLAADKLFLTKEINILKLVHRLHQKNIFKDQVEVGNTYDIEAHISSYKVRTAIKICYYNVP